MEIANTINNKILEGSNDADSIYNSGSKVSINSYGGNDSIRNSGTEVSINAGAGDNVINMATYSYSRYDNYIVTGDGNNLVNNDTVERSKIITGAGHDTIITGGYGTSINAGAGNNNISVVSSSNSTISAGDGDDFAKRLGQ